jgi:hypothetical protein
MPDLAPKTKPVSIVGKNIATAMLTAKLGITVAITNTIVIASITAIKVNLPVVENFLLFI